MRSVTAALVAALVAALMAALVVALLVACGGKPAVPRRLVVETDLGSWKFRRFQGPLLDYEVWIEGNKGEKYSASYVTEASEKRGHIDDKDLVNVTVTRYARRDGVVRETVKLVRRLAQERGYQVTEKQIEGVRALTIVGPSEMWAIWPSGNYVVMVGGQGRETVPDSMVEQYGERYPSQLPGGSLEGALPPGPEAKPAAEPTPYDANNPKPDMQKYDADKVKIPETQADDDADSPKAKRKQKKTRP